MGNNLLNACKNTSAQTEQNDGESEQTQKEKQEKRKLERKRNQRNKSDLNSVHAEDILEKQGMMMMARNQQQNEEGQSDSSSQQLNGFDGQSYQSQEINSVYNQNSEDHLHKMRKSQHKYSKKSKSHHLVNNFISSKIPTTDKFALSQQESLSTDKDPTAASSAVQPVDEIRQLKNNNDRYFSKEDQEYYEKKFQNEKKVTPPKDRNIRWQQGEVLGTGSFGQVILGMNIDTGEFMAVKQVHIGGYNQQDRQEKIQQIQSEIEALRNLSDKNIVRYIGIKKSETSINIFLEYVPGGSISSLLYRYGHFNETLIRKFTTQILKGLEYLHAHEIIHRDIKGANVLVDKDGNCKLADFGSAKNIVEEKGHNDSIRGTPYWMAPETIKQLGSGRYADIWSIGCTVIEMATAKPPWAEKNPIQAMFFIANAQEPPPIPENLSADCKDFISKCLKINPNDRYNVRQLLSHTFVTGKKQTQISSGRQLAQITEEATVDYQTSSPDKRKDFLTRGESRGNTLFHEEISMKDTSTEKIKTFSIKTRTQKSTKSRKSIRQRESDGDNSQDSIDLGKSKNSMNNPRPLNPQPKMIQSRSNQPQNYGSNGKNQNNYSGEKYQNSADKVNIIKDKSSESSSRSSSNSSNSQERKTNNTQISYTNTENIPIRKKQVTPFSISHKQVSQQQHHRNLLLQQSQQSMQLQQPSEYTKSIYTQDLERDKSSFITKEQSYTSQSSTETVQMNKQSDLNNQTSNLNVNNGNSNFNNKSSNRLDSPLKSQNTNTNQNNNNNNGQSLFANGQNKNNNYDSNSSSNSNKQNNEANLKKQEAPLQIENIYTNSYRNNGNNRINNQQMVSTQQVSLGQKQVDRKVQKLGELNDSSSSSNSSSLSPRRQSQSPPKNQHKNSSNTLNQQQNNNKNIFDHNKQEHNNKQLIYVNNYNEDEDEEEEDVQFQFDQKAVDSIMQYQGQQNNNQTNYTNSEYNKNGRNKNDSIQQQSQISDTTGESFNKDKFGKLRYSKPTSPKQLTTSGGTNYNNNSFDQIAAYDYKTNNVITENTNKNISSLKQEQVKEYSKYFGQQATLPSAQQISSQPPVKGRNEDYNASSIDQKLVSQYMNQQNQKYATSNSNQQNTRHIDSINIEDDYSESQFESYTSKEQRSKQNIITKEY